MVASTMIVATRMFDRMKGLMFSEKLPQCDGFLIRPCNSIHTFFMLYPLDVLFLNNNFEVVKVIYNLSPWRMTGIYFKSNQVLEMQAGTMPPNIALGEKLEVTCLS